MTKAELREQLESGKSLDNVLPFTDGQECVIYKMENFEVSDEIIYIPDMGVIDIPIYLPLSDEEIEDVINHCYTGNNFMEIAKNHKKLAVDLWNYIDWQNPDLDDFLMGYEEEQFKDDYGFDMNELEENF